MDTKKVIDLHILVVLFPDVLLEDHLMVVLLMKDHLVLVPMEDGPFDRGPGGGGQLGGDGDLCLVTPSPPEPPGPPGPQEHQGLLGPADPNANSNTTGQGTLFTTLSRVDLCYICLMPSR